MADLIEGEDDEQSQEESESSNSSSSNYFTFREIFLDPDEVDSNYNFANETITMSTDIVVTELETNGQATGWFGFLGFGGHSQAS